MTPGVRLIRRHTGIVVPAEDQPEHGHGPRGYASDHECVSCTVQHEHVPPASGCDRPRLHATPPPKTRACWACCGPITPPSPFCGRGWRAVDENGEPALRGAGQTWAGSARSRVRTSGSRRWQAGSRRIRWRAWRISRPCMMSGWRYAATSATRVRTGPRQSTSASRSAARIEEGRAPESERWPPAVQHAEPRLVSRCSGPSRRIRPATIASVNAVPTLPGIPPAVPCSAQDQGSDRVSTLVLCLVPSPMMGFPVSFLILIQSRRPPGWVAREARGLPPPLPGHA